VRFVSFAWRIDAALIRQTRLLGAEYRELAIGGGHVWMFEQHSLLASILRDAPRVATTPGDVRPDSMDSPARLTTCA
jgi:hypothetical protein